MDPDTDLDPDPDPEPDPNPNWAKILDPDPNSMYSYLDPQHWSVHSAAVCLMFCQYAAWLFDYCSVSR